MISKVLSTSKKFAAAGRSNLGEFAQLLYALLLPHADDFGRQEGDPFTVKHKVLPTSPRPETEFSAALAHLQACGLIEWYDSEQGQVVEITAFDQHQTGLHKRTESRFPGNSRKFPEVPENSALTELKGRELKGTEEEEKAATPPAHVLRHPGLIRNSLDYDRKLKRCAYVGARLEVPNKLHADLVRDMGGTDADGKLRAWYAAVDEEIEASAEAILPDVFKWLTARWRVWAEKQQTEAALTKFMEGGRG